MRGICNGCGKSVEMVNGSNTITIHRHQGVPCSGSLLRPRIPDEDESNPVLPIKVQRTEVSKIPAPEPINCQCDTPDVDITDPDCHCAKCGGPL